MSDEPAKLSFKLRPAPTATAAAAPEATPENVAPSAPSPAASSPAAKHVQKVALGIGVGGLVVFLGIGFIAFPRLMAQTRALNEAQQRFEAEEAAAMRAARAARAERIAAEKPAPTPLPASTNPQPAAASATAAPAQPLASSAPTAPVSGDDAFRIWVTTAKIGGVRKGRVVRILIGHSAYTLGDIVDPALGIRFDSYEASTHTVRFRDDAGHTMERRD